ncbi:MAG TPA: hypothetical protein VGB83_00780 [Actinomycetota bacterium]
MTDPKKERGPFGKVFWAAFGFLDRVANHVTNPIAAAIVLVFGLATLATVAALMVGATLGMPLSGLAALAFLALLVYGLGDSMLRKSEGTPQVVKQRIVESRQEFDPPQDTVAFARGLPAGPRSDIKLTVMKAVTEVADILGITRHGVVRGNLFGKDGDNWMRMLQGMTHNMNHPPELTITMPVGEGSTGTCFHRNESNVAILDPSGAWPHPYSLPPAEVAKAHPNLKWIISFPVRVGPGRGTPLWILNVDGLTDPPPALVPKTHDDRIWRQVKHWMEKYADTIAVYAAEAAR